MTVTTMVKSNSSWQRRLMVLAIVFVLGTLAGGLPRSVMGDERLSFNRDIRPILSDHCFQCHGPDEQTREGELRLDQAAFAFDPGASGDAAIVPGDIVTSVLLHRVQADDPSEQMPPPELGKPLTKIQIDLLERWISEGAKYEDHWAFLKPERPRVPAVQNGERVSNEIDQFLLANLEAKGFTYSPAASRETLIRRVTLDLTGLPPTPDEVRAFLDDNSAEAYERVVDRLLSSPRYGEHMASQWLDLARYADSNGYQVDSSRQQWPWRDWVINAFNNNLPYDQFTIEQLAGDLLPDATLDQKVATGFHRNHRLNGEGGIIAEEWRVETVMDRVETTGLTWLGLTFNCCRCHDHKYDPITQREFYSMFSYFNNIAESGTLQGESRNTDPVIPVPSPMQQSQLQAMNLAKEKAEAELARTLEQLPTLVANWEPGFRHELDGALPTWTTLQPTVVISTSGTTLTRRPDGSYLASGANPQFDVYEIEAPLTSGVWTGLLLECLTDESLPNQSVGRYPNGNFVLSHVEAEISAPTLEKPLTANFTQAVADYSQSDWEIGLTLKKVPGKGWAVDGPTKRENRRAMFLNEFALTVPEGATIKVRLVQKSLNQHNIGCFRISTTGVSAGLVTLDGPYIPESLRGIVMAPPEQRTTAQIQELHNYFRQHVDSPIRTAEAEVARLTNEINDFRKTWPTVMVMQEIPQPREAFVLVRGEYDQRGELVTARVPDVLPPLSADEPNNRLGLARWIVSPENPLTARVWVNRVWERFMGIGIVKTTENFGSQAEWPSHPDLLDWLAMEFMQPQALPDVNGVAAQKWDMKALKKLIVMSSAYRQSSSFHVPEELLEQDPENRWLGRGPRFRLTAEMVRDQALAVSGLLVEKIGGPSVRPYMPKGVWDETSVYGDLRNYQHATDDGLFRRTLYTVWKRTAAPPTLMLFDAPNREVCTVIRSRTNTPLQALSLLNEVTYVEAARKLGERMLADGGANPADRLTFGFQLVTARKPSERELNILLEGLAVDLAHFREHAQSAEAFLQVGETQTGSFDSAELAAYTLVGNVLLNLDETITRE